MKKCPLLKKKCIQNECMWWVEMTVKDIVTQEIKQANDCAICKLPILAVELLRNVNGVQQAVESHRNADVRLKTNLLHMVDGRLQLADSER